MLRRFPVFVQIAAGFSFGVLLLALTASTTFARVSDMRARAAETSALQHISTLARDVLARLLDEESGIRGYAATGDKRYLNTVRSGRTAAQIDLWSLDNSDRTRAVSSNILEQVIIVSGEIQQDANRLDAAYSNVARDVAAGDRSGTASVLWAAKGRFDRLREHRDALLGYTSAGAQNAQSRFDDARGAVTTTLLGATFLAIVLFLAAAALVSRSIATRLSSVTCALGQVTAVELPNLVTAFGCLASGDLSARFRSERRALALSGRDEIAALENSYNAVARGLDEISDEFDRMTARLRKTIAGISGSASQLAGAGELVAGAAGESRAAVSQIYTAISDVAGGSGDQSRNVLVVRSQIEELHFTAGLIADGSQIQMRAASAQDLPAIVRVAERNEYIAQDVRDTADRLMLALLPLAASAEQQSRTAQEATNAAAWLDRQIAAIDTGSESSLAQSERLRTIISAYRAGTLPFTEAS